MPSTVPRQQLDPEGARRVDEAHAVVALYKVEAPPMGLEAEGAAGIAGDELHRLVMRDAHAHQRRRDGGRTSGTRRRATRRGRGRCELMALTDAPRPQVGPCQPALDRRHRTLSPFGGRNSATHFRPPRRPWQSGVPERLVSECYDSRMNRLLIIAGLVLLFAGLFLGSPARPAAVPPARRHHDRPPGLGFFPITTMLLADVVLSIVLLAVAALTHVARPAHRRAADGAVRGRGVDLGGSPPHDRLGQHPVDRHLPDRRRRAGDDA